MNKDQLNEWVAFFDPGGLAQKHQVTALLDWWVCFVFGSGTRQWPVKTPLWHHKGLEPKTVFFLCTFSQVFVLQCLLPENTGKFQHMGYTRGKHWMCLTSLNMASTGERERPYCGPALGLTSADRKMCSAVKRNRMSGGKHTQRVGAELRWSIHNIFFPDSHRMSRQSAQLRWSEAFRANFWAFDYESW